VSDAVLPTAGAVYVCGAAPLSGEPARRARGAATSRRTVPRLLAFLATTGLLVSASALTPALAAAAGPTITVKGANPHPRHGPDAAVLYECPLSVTYSGGAPGAMVNVDVVTVTPTTPTGQTVLVGGPRALTLSGSGDAAAVSSQSDLTFTGVTSQPDPNSDLYKIQVRVTDGAVVTTSAFWVADCVPAASPPTTTTTTTTLAPAAPISTTTTTIQAVVLGETITRGPAPAVVAGTRTTLPATGSNTLALLMLAGLLLAGGSAMTLFAKLGGRTR
jgi:hypothetical protein